MARPATSCASTDPEVEAWATSGAMALTATAGGARLGPPEGMVARLRSVAGDLRSGVAVLGGALEVDPLPLLTERAVTSDLGTGGAVSCGGSSRLIDVGGRWLAVSLARPEDVELVPAWLGLDGPPDDPWAAVGATARSATARSAADLVEQAILLGLPVGLLPETSATPTTAPVRPTALPGRPPPTASIRDVVVVDLTSLWAGPLCGRLLAEAGASVVKVESTARPDGARRGPTAFFDLLNHRKRSVALDLRTSSGVDALARLLAGADVVLEASRPRALEQLGLDAKALVAGGGPRVWASITGHGRTGLERDRVGFGDDAAVAGGLVAWGEDRPHFVADAVADPTTGLIAAAAVVDALARGGRWLLDISLAGVAAHLRGPTLALPLGPVDVAQPAPIPAPPPAAELGAHTTAVLGGVGVGCDTFRVPPWTSTNT